MDTDTILQILSTARKQLLTQARPSTLALESLAQFEPSRTISLGYSRNEHDAIALEVRAEESHLTAKQYAEDLAKISGLPVNFETFEALPSIYEEHSSGTCHPAMGKNARLHELCIGASISHEDGPSGSLGLFVEHADGTAILSCSHVMRPHKRVQKGDYIHHPGLNDVTIPSSEHEIAILRAYSKFNHVTSMPTDSAVAIIDKGQLVRGNIISDSLECPDAGREITGVMSLDFIRNEFRVGSKLCKIGRTTGYSTGTLHAYQRFQVFQHLDGQIEFCDILEIDWPETDKPYSLPGDSGGLVYCPKTMQAVGLHIGSVQIVGKRRRSYACLIDHAFKTWNISLLKNKK